MYRDSETFLFPGLAATQQHGAHASPNGDSNLEDSNLSQLSKLEQEFLATIGVPEEQTRFVTAPSVSPCSVAPTFFLPSWSTTPS